MLPRMVLAIDVGNTSVSAALVRDGALDGRGRTPSRRDATTAELDAALAGILAAAGATWEAVAGISCSSVVPTLTARIREMAAARALPLLLATHETVPIPIRVDDPATVGADRLVDAYAAARLHGAPTVVLDFGTATTVDGVGPDGAYLGGAIAPGLELGLDALAARTALLPRVELQAPGRALATNTVEAIQAGAVLGYQALAAGLLARVRRELSASTGVPERQILSIATGGLSAAPWARAIEGLDVVDPDLTLRGLAALWAEVGAPAGAAR